MAVIRLTDLAVRALPEGVYFDERTPSFGLLVGKRRKTWLVVKGRGRVRVRLGHYPALSLAEARKKALVALGMPFEPVASPKFSEILETFLETHGATLRPRSRYQLQRTLRRYFKWERPLDKITHDDVATVIDGIAAKSEAAHALKDIRTFFNWCIPRYLSASPCAGLKKQSFKPRERVLTDDELVKVWRRADDIGHPYGTIVKLLMLTGQRAGEIAALRWAWISDATLSLPADITKNGRATTIPLGGMARSVIEKVPKKGLLLFPARGHDDKPFQGFGVNKLTLDKCGVENFTHHDLRRTFATNMASLGVRLEVTEKLLNHVSGSLGGIVGVYQKYDFQPEMRKAANEWEAKLSRLLAREKAAT
jgi:integrase